MHIRYKEGQNLQVEPIKTDKVMKEAIDNFKIIMQDKRERKEFIGGVVCVVITMALAYMTIVIFH